MAFEGEPFAEGEIDVNDLAPALLALGDVIQAANRALNGGRVHARLKLRATNEGSFEALLSIDVSMVDAIRDILDAVAESPDRVVAADQLLDLLIKGGTILGVSLTSLFGAVKLLRGRRPDKVEDRGDGMTSITVNQTTIIVDKRTVDLLENLPTREALEDFGSKALGVPGVTSLKIGEKGSEDELVLTANDRSAFKVPEPVDEEPQIDVMEREVWLKIVTSHFRDGYKWRFTDGGDKPFTADMEDAEFLNQALEGKIALSANDTLRCQIREEQKLTSAGLTKEVKVVKVIEHIPGAKQFRLL
ncbi:hypothetical protein GCM10007972_24700 [Iodidimonas muriae]|uniref:Uncharacterized protein n=1 Tax=Iodidimonas muriae TaxID=261467 RepID=A0ABQ2LFM0_9PROT|nr:hypothetical protein GCM10007972_24700 [Iodidimonas muriae]